MKQEFEKAKFLLALRDGTWLTEHFNVPLEILYGIHPHLESVNFVLCELKEKKRDSKVVHCFLIDPKERKL